MHVPNSLEVENLKILDQKLTSIKLVKTCERVF